MTDSDRRLLDFLKWCRRPPTYRDIQLWGGYSSTSMVDKALKRLEDGGHITRGNGIAVVTHPPAVSHPLIPHD